MPFRVPRDLYNQIELSQRFMDGFRCLWSIPHIQFHLASFPHCALNNYTNRQGTYLEQQTNEVPGSSLSVSSQSQISPNFLGKMKKAAKLAMKKYWGALSTRNINVNAKERDINDKLCRLFGQVCVLTLSDFAITDDFIESIRNVIFNPKNIVTGVIVASEVSVLKLHNGPPLIKALMDWKHQATLQRKNLYQRRISRL